MSNFAEKISKFSRERLALLCTELQGRLEKLESPRQEPVAIVGMACRFPGGATDLERFWELLHNGVDAVTEIPPDRWDVDAFYDPDPDAPGKMYCRHGGFLDDVDQFDPSFFNISPREAVSLDPQYRLLLEVAWQALEHAGQSPSGLRGTRTGVFVGVGTDDYAKMQVRLGDPESITAYTGTGNAYCYGVGRLSYFLGLHGPNFPVDTACSSSLVVTHLACQSLLARECDLALAGGVHLMLSPVGTIFLSKARALSPGGRCKTFDAAADGFVRGEGCGILVLKRLSDAIANRDRVYAVIRGSAINHDGPSSGFTVPNGPAQRAVIEDALKSARVEPREVGYVEAHGTGTPLGDPIEVRSLAATLGRSAGRPADNPLVIGSVKTNFGHLESAAGVAGLIKSVLALQHEEIPPHLHLGKINPHIPLEDGPFVVPTRPLPWPRSGRERIAGVSSFGLSGTNAHVILQEAPANEGAADRFSRPLHVLTLSARTEGALRAMAGRLERHLAKGGRQPIANTCFTANTGRSHFAHRLAVVADSGAQLRKELQAFSQERKPSAVVSGKVETGRRPKVAFLFGGEGSQYFGMGSDLYASEPRFREAVQQCEEVLGPDLGQQLSKVLSTDGTQGQPLREPILADAALFALEYALVQLWRSWGVEPSAVLGHGLGEYVAAATAGVFTLEDALRLVTERARLAQSSPSGWQAAAVLADEGRVRKAVENAGGEVVITAINSPRNVVVFGPQHALGKFIERLKDEGVRTHPIPGGALYSAAALPILDRLEESAARVNYRPPQIPMVSTVTGEFVRGEVAEARHWLKHASQPVKFAAGIETLHGKGHDVYLEIGPKSVLTRWGKQCLPEANLSWLASLGPGEDWRQVLSSLSQLYVLGAAVDWAGFDRPYGRERVPLPSYPFERRRFWLEMSRPSGSAVLTTEEDAMKDATLRPKIERLLRTCGDDGAQAFNRRVTAPLIFLPSTGQSFFYLNVKGSSMVIQTFVGLPESFEPTAREVLQYARSRGLNLIIFAPEERAARLRELGLTTTPVGVWQSINDTNSFSIQDPAMRRLRSKANSYRNRGPVSIEEYRIGADAATDRRMVELIDSWVARKRRKTPFVSLLKDEILNASLNPKYRVFLTRRAGEIESVILLAPIEAKNGYLLDLEFYPAGMPSGCLEYSIVSTIEQLNEEGFTYYSLGSTFGTQLESDAHGDPRVRDLLQSFHQEGILNDDGIFEFKKKFHPSTTRLYVCCLPEVDISALPDMLLMLAAPERMLQGREQAPPAVADQLPNQVPPVAGGEGPAKAANNGQAAPPPIHPLLGHRLPLASADIVFESRLDLADREWSWLADHRVLEHAVLPAAAYVEMAVAASASLSRSGRHTLEGVSFLEALPFTGQGRRIVQLIFSAEAGGGGTFRVWSRNGEAEQTDNDWVLHATGTVSPSAVRPAGAGGAPASSLADIRQRLQPAEVTSYYDQIEQFGLQYGESFRAIRELWSGFGEAFARVQLPGRQLPEVDKYHLHPALLDACLQVQGAALLASRGEHVTPSIYLPVGAERIRYVSRPGTSALVHCRLRPVEGDDLQEVVGDIRVTDDSGNLLVDVVGLTVRRTSREVLQRLMEGRPGKMLYQVEWRPHARGQATKPDAVEGPGGWVIFADTAGTASRLSELLRERGEGCAMVYQDGAFETAAPDRWCLNPAEPEHFHRLFKEAGPVRRVVYLWPADAAPLEDLDLDSLRRSHRSGCQGLLHLLQALAAAEGTGSRQLWVVTRGSQPVGGALGGVSPAHSPVWGLGRTIAQEHPEIWGGLIDLESHASPVEAELLLEEIGEPEEEDHLAFRDGQRYIARVVGKEIWKAAPSPRFRSDATYMITGGAGGLGLTVARWMVARGARHLVLVGRKAASGEVDEALAELREAGAREAVYQQADISQQNEVTRLLSNVAQNLPPLRGIIHAAGVLADGTLLQQSWPRFLQVMAAKIDGAWNLHDLTRNLALDHFVLFSSSASILGAAGQGNYAAANAFLDGLAHFRQAQGLPAMSINWGPWAEVGMAAALDPRAQAQRAAQGIRPLPPAEGVRLLEQVMTESWPQVGVISVDWEKLLGAASPMLRHSSLFKGLVAVADVAGGEDGEGASPFVNSLLSAGPDERQGLLQSYVTELVAVILGSEAGSIDPVEGLTSQGFDSLMALELRERVEAELGVSIPILNFFRGNSIAELTAFLLAELAKKFPGVFAQPAEGMSPEDLLAKLGALSDAEVDAALRQVIAEEK